MILEKMKLWGGGFSAPSPSVPTTDSGAIVVCESGYMRDSNLEVVEATSMTFLASGQIGGEGISITNLEFINAVFHALPEGASAVVCSKRGDPTSGPWMGLSAMEVQAECPASQNNYLNCSSFKPDIGGSLKARKDNAAAFHCLVLDDVGTKVSRDGLGAFAPSWEIETSPGNHQVGIVLNQALTKGDEVTRLQNAVIAAGLSDPGASGQARWVRLPVGINGKEKYTTEAGQPFQCRLVLWHPERRYSAEEIVAGLGLDKAPVSAPGQDALDTAQWAGQRAVSRPAGSIADADKVAKMAALLAVIDADCGYGDWLHVLMAIFHETAGGDDGLVLADKWSRKGSKYKGTKEVEAKWRSFRDEVSSPVTIATLIKMAGDAEADVHAIMHDGDEDFEPCETEVIDPRLGAPNKAPPGCQALARYSLQGQLPYLEQQMVEQILILGSLVLLGQATVIYALANTGKTLIVLHLIIEAIKSKRLDPSKLFYINMDDNSSGLVDKVRLAEEYGFHMVADGHQGFEAKEFRAAMEKMIATDTARGVIVVLDTLKKFVNTMDKSKSSDFAKVIRQFSLKGGTVIALAHANKHPGSDGRPVYSGTTDIVDDFDCGFTLATVSRQAETDQKVVEFSNIKRRGNVALTAAYSYALERDASYNDLLLSVREVDPEQLVPIKHAAEVQSDAEVIAAVQACIANGINSKMKLVDAAAKNIAASRRTVLKVVEKYTGEVPGLHRWRYEVHNRGAKVFQLLNQAPPSTSLEAPKA